MAPLNSRRSSAASLSNRTAASAAFFCSNTAFLRASSAAFAAAAAPTCADSMASFNSENGFSTSKTAEPNSLIEPMGSEKSKESTESTMAPSFSKRLTTNSTAPASTPSKMLPNLSNAFPAKAPSLAKTLNRFSRPINSGTMTATAVSSNPSGLAAMALPNTPNALPASPVAFAPPVCAVLRSACALACALANRMALTCNACLRSSTAV